jgi:hypothetical protein
MRDAIVNKQKPISQRSGKEDHRQGRRPWRCHPAGELLRQTNPIWRCALGYKDRMCETNPVSPVAWSPGGRNVRNEANSEQVGRGRPTHEETIMRNKPDRPKRGTEAVSAVAAFASPHYSSIPSFHHSSPMPIVPNKPNSPAQPRWDGVRGTRGRAAIVQNEAKLALGVQKWARAGGPFHLPFGSVAGDSWPDGALFMEPDARALSSWNSSS